MRGDGRKEFDGVWNNEMNASERHSHTTTAPHYTASCNVTIFFLEHNICNVSCGLGVKTIFDNKALKSPYAPGSSYANNTKKTSQKHTKVSPDYVPKYTPPN